jgi:membrane glycosyltransferase
MGYEMIEMHPLSEATDSQHSLILFSSLTIVLLFSTGIMSIFCFMNFNKGLKGAGELKFESTITLAINLLGGEF